MSKLSYFNQYVSNNHQRVWSAYCLQVISNGYATLICAPLGTIFILNLNSRIVSTPNVVKQKNV